MNFHDFFCHLYTDDTIIVLIVKNTVKLNTSFTGQLSSVNYLIKLEWFCYIICLDGTWQKYLRLCASVKGTFFIPLEGTRKYILVP